MRLSKITTRTGDKGTTGLADGARVRKDHARIAALVGEVPVEAGAVALVERLERRCVAIAIGEHQAFVAGRFVHGAQCSSAHGDALLALFSGSTAGAEGGLPDRQVRGSRRWRRLGGADGTGGMSGRWCTGVMRYRIHAFIYAMGCPFRRNPSMRASLIAVIVYSSS